MSPSVSADPGFSAHLLIDCNIHDFGQVVCAWRVDRPVGTSMCVCTNTNTYIPHPPETRRDAPEVAGEAVVDHPLRELLLHDAVLVVAAVVCVLCIMDVMEGWANM